MNDVSVRRLTGVVGVVAVGLTLAELALYFVYSGPPPDSNVLSRSLVGIVGNTLLVVFVSGLRQIVKHADPAYEWVGWVASVAGLMWLTIAFVSVGLETGPTIASPTPVDGTIAVPGTYILYGSVSRLLQALFLTAFGYATLRSGALPRWVGRSAYVLAVISLAFVPSLYFGNVPAHFYAANGWGTTAGVSGLFILWLLAVSISILRSLRRPDAKLPSNRACR